MDYLFSIGNDSEYEGEQYACAFSDGNRMKYLLEHNHVSVRWNGNDVHGNILSAKQVLTYEKELSDAGSFLSKRRLSQVISADYFRRKHLSQSAVNDADAHYTGGKRRLSRAYFSAAEAGLK